MTQAGLAKVYFNWNEVDVESPRPAERKQEPELP